LTEQPVAGVVLAAGLSRRFGHRPKLLAPLGGVSIIERVLGAYARAGLDELVLVVAPGLDVAELAARCGARMVANPHREAGQSTSLRVGLQAISPRAAGAVLGVADQPFLTPEVIRRLVEEFRVSGGPIVAPEYAGRAGSPLVFSRRYFRQLEEIEGDVGGRVLVAKAGPDAVHRVAFADPMLGLDIDTPEDLARAEAYLT